ncbi:MAG TPA: zinc ribbon domain-containing protein [Planctomycetota bacterium]|nr:zinc ribbon domain-containing protein [Planctomycetota bacterium]
MPTYDYRCDACGHAFDAFQSITEPALKKCPKCGKNRLRRLIGAGAGIIFKGSGFYETDYKRSRTSSDSSEKKSSESKSADSKPAEPAEKPSKKKPSK